jgi:L-lactate dehydrogenase complex protein LldE
VSSPEPAAPRVGLFVTCLVDLLRPSIGFAAVKLLEQAGCRVEVPRGQTCCGQPAFNSGDAATARRLARQTIQCLEGYDSVVLPSGSCGGMLKLHYPELFAQDPYWCRRAQALAARSFELTSFLFEQRKAEIHNTHPASATYHDSCSGLRELGIREQPRRLLQGVAGLTLQEMPDRDVCCGFGGTFCVKYPDISSRMVSDKAAAILSTGAELLLGGDLGCLMNIAGRLKRLGADTRVRHVAEVLAGMNELPAIGEGRSPG